MNTPKVSVVVASYYGGEQALQASIDSLLRQSLAAWELLCVHHARETFHATAADTRVRCIRTGYRDRSGARYAGLQAARAPYVLFLEAGDTLANTALEQMWHAAENSVDSAALSAAPEELPPAPWGRLYHRESICHEPRRVSLEGYVPPSSAYRGSNPTVHILPPALYCRGNKECCVARRHSEAERVLAAYLQELFSSLCHLAG